jgi:hypothetical protein
MEYRSTGESMKDKWKYLDNLIESLDQDFEDTEEVQESILQRMIQKYKAKMKSQKPKQDVEEESALMRVLRKRKNKPSLKERVIKANVDELEGLVEESDEANIVEAMDDKLDAYALSRASMWLGVLLGAATPYIGNTSLLLVPSVNTVGEYYIFSRNRRIEMEVKFMEDGSVAVNVEQAPAAFYRTLRLNLQNLRRVRILLSPISTQSEDLNKVLSTFSDLKVQYTEGEESDW